MNIRTPKVEENKSRSVANSVAQKKSNVKQGFGFVDNRAEAVAQRKLEEMSVNHSVQEHQLIQKKVNKNETLQRQIDETWFKNLIISPLSKIRAILVSRILEFNNLEDPAHPAVVNSYRKILRKIDFKTNKIVEKTQNLNLSKEQIEEMSNKKNGIHALVTRADSKFGAALQQFNNDDMGQGGVPRAEILEEG